MATLSITFSFIKPLPSNIASVCSLTDVFGYRWSVGNKIYLKVAPWSSFDPKLCACKEMQIEAYQQAHGLLKVSCIGSRTIALEGPLCFRRTSIHDLTTLFVIYNILGPT